MGHIIVNIDDAERVFSTEENVKGRIEITVPNIVTVHNDDIRIAFEGIQHIWQISDGYGAGPLSGRYDIRKKFLNQQLHPSRSDIAVTELSNGSKLITVAFDFKIPDKLLPTNCKHDGADSSLHREHLQLPPTMGRSNWSSKRLDDLTPDMINVSYMVRAQLLKRGDDKNVLAENVRQVFVLPRYPEKPAQYISPSDEGRGLYRLWQSQEVRSGKLHIEAEQPKPVRIVGLKSCGTTVPVRLRFIADGNEARLPVIDTLGLDFNAISHYSAIGIGDDITVASAVEGVHTYPRRIFSASRDCGRMGWTKDIDGSYLSELAVPITVPDDKLLLPSVQNCHMARTYMVELRIVLGGKGKERATGRFALKVPVQVVVEHRPFTTDITPMATTGAEARVSEDGIELANLPPGYGLHPTRSLAQESTLPPPPLEHDSYPLTEAQIPAEGAERPPLALSMLETAIIIFSVTGAVFLGSMSNGIMVVALPTIAKDIGLSQSLTLWPQSIFSLVCGSFLLLLGNITDIVGSRRTFLFGCILYTIFTLVQGFCNSGGQLIAFRAIQGFAMAACLPSAVSALTNSFPAGQWRNLGFVMLSAGQPLGFAVGLVVSGVLIRTIGWRWIFYISTGINAAISVGAAFALPNHLNNHNLKFKDFYEADWVGSAIASGALGTFSYVVATTSESYRRWSSPSTITLIVLSAILAYAFFLWVTRQERLGRPCLIPPSLWRNTAFTAICGTVFFTWAAVNACTLTMTLVFQEVQHLSPSETSLRLLPDVGSGFLVSILVGYFIDKTSTYWLVVSAAAVTLASPLLMALMDPGWSYWAAAFPAVFLAPVSTDVLYTVSNLVITREFPKKTQGLAGAVFNTLVQISNSVGIGLSSLVAAMVMQRAAGGKNIQMVAHDELVVGGGNATEWYAGVELEGYRGSFWTCFGFSAAAVVVSSVWLRDIVDVGKKED